MGLVRKPTIQHCTQGWENQSLCESDIGSAKMYLYDNDVKQWRRNINDTVVNPKLRTYCTFKDYFTMEPYLLHICDFELRMLIGTFRWRCHNLDIEKGRHWGIPLGQNFCSVCSDSTSIAIEHHLSMSCTFYTDIITIHMTIREYSCWMTHTTKYVELWNHMLPSGKNARKQVDEKKWEIEM